MYVYKCREAKGEFAVAAWAQAEASGSKQGGMGMSYLFMIEFDTDHDNKVSVQEWLEGFQGQREEDDDDDQNGLDHVLPQAR